ncbi:YceD family protein [Sphingomonas radiodurans]|uniref:YceD family protein n=1 Tax=Sphingomonas radiodurans TaxID=2890321 RepID=UPI001E50DE56|nr:DUF177 domain-containing protein [Sphingomonas radiodurans]WBH15229.1 DUF177 domain-containing protein [Sphingomonas radiodurans]
MMPPEFSRPVRVDTIGTEPKVVTVTADAAERVALARRFGLIAIERLEGRFTLQRSESGVALEGRVIAVATQACSITDEPLDASIDEEARLRFVDDPTEGEEIELDEDAIDVLPIENGAIDLGEAAAETLALSIDPFVRGPNAAAALAAAGVIAEEDAKPLGAFAGLRDKLAGK